MLNDDVKSYIQEHQEEAYQLLVELAQIPAPSHHEEKRAAFCKQWLESQGAKGVLVDDALNVIYPVGCTASNPVVVFMAHMDVVFPDMEPLPLKVENGRIYAPGVGDDTANLVALLMTAKYVTEKAVLPQNTGMLFIANSCEEGIGNLKGSRKIIDTYGDRITEFYSLDGGNANITNRAVGSKRYRVSVKTEGGHSFTCFGNRNAIEYLASLINTPEIRTSLFRAFVWFLRPNKLMLKRES